MIYTPLTIKAMQLCLEAHRDQVDKGGMPYSYHPIHVAESMTDEIRTVTALLHDVVEDTDYTFQDIREMGFPEEVVEALSVLSHKRGVPYLDYIAEVINNPIAIDVKEADLKHNMDLKRLGDPSEKDLKRFEKYRKALEQITMQKYFPTSENGQTNTEPFTEAVRNELRYRGLSSKKVINRFLDVSGYCELLKNWQRFGTPDSVANAVDQLVAEAVKKLLSLVPEDENPDNEWRYSGSIWNFVDTVLWSVVFLKLHEEGAEDEWNIMSNTEKMRAKAENYRMTDRAVIHEMLRLGIEAKKRLDDDGNRRKVGSFETDKNGRITCVVRIDDWECEK